MHDPERPPEDPEETWDQWFGRTYERRAPSGWRLVVLVAAVAIFSLYWITMARGG